MKREPTHTFQRQTKMAEQTGEDVISGENLDAILQLLFCDFFEEEMKSLIDEVTDEVISKVCLFYSENVADKKGNTVFT